MPFLSTSITVGTALAVGLGAAAVGTGIYALAGGFDSDEGPSDSRVDVTGTGRLTGEEATKAAKKKAFRAGIIHTSPTGLEEKGKTSSAKLR